MQALYGIDLVITERAHLTMKRLIKTFMGKMSPLV